jgi:arylsulfatase A-like enzyme
MGDILFCSFNGICVDFQAAVQGQDIEMSQNESIGKPSRREFLCRGAGSLVTGSLAASLFTGGCSRGKLSQRPNIILITLDTTRADRLSCYGYQRRTSPNIDKLALQSLRYVNALATSSWTLPSHASLFTGKFTSSHGAEYNADGPLKLVDAIAGPSQMDVYKARGLAQNEITLASILKQYGYSTAAVVAGPWLKRVFGLDKGFDFYDDNEISTADGRTARQVSNATVKWLNGRSDDKPFFLFLNYFDPHAPYMAPEGFAWFFMPENNQFSGIKKFTAQEKNALYDGEILYMDHYTGLLWNKLEQEKLYDNALIIVTADHGELLGEHEIFGHGQFLYQEELHVPLLVKYPSGEVSPAVANDRIQLTDIMALILERLSLELPPGVQSGPVGQLGHPIMAEVYPLAALRKTGDWRAIFQEQYKFLWNSLGNNMLFNLAADPREQNNLVVKDPARAEAMLSALNRYLAQLPPPGAVNPAAQQPDPETQKALKSLGYVQ